MSTLHEISWPHRLELYRWAVQDPETHAVLFRVIYERVRSGRTPAVLREDFAGTAADSVAWVAIKSGRTAIVIDIDRPTIDWARNRASRILGKRVDAIQFIEADLFGPSPLEVAKADITVALNYSIMQLHERASLLSYLRAARAGLDAKGVFICNIFGGIDASRAGTTRHQIVPAPRLPSEKPIRPFEYEWEIVGVDSQSLVADCRIHFQLNPISTDDLGHALKDAFRYHFRLWSAEEIVSACEEAGFRCAQVWRHTYDPAKGTHGVFLGPVEPLSLAGLSTWNVYIVAMGD